MVSDVDKDGAERPQGAALQISDDAVFTVQQSAANILRESKERYINEGAKGLLLINGAGAVALLALLQAIWGKDGAAAFSNWVLYGTTALAVGVVVAASIFMFRHRAYVVGAHNAEHRLYRWTHWYIPSAAILCFVVGVGLTVYGGLKHFPADKPSSVPATEVTLPGPS